MAIFPGPDKSVFWFDFEALTSDNLWVDRGPYQLNTAPQAGFAAPNYGLAKSAHGKGYCDFNGGPFRYGNLPARFFTNAPTGRHTWVYVCDRFTINGVTQRFFDCTNLGGGGINRGIANGVWMGGPSQLIYCCQGGAPTEYVASTGPIYPSLAGAGSSAVVFTIEEAPKVWWNRRPGNCAWGVGSYGSPVYDATMIPRIGADQAGGNLLTCRLFFLALFPFVFSDSEAKAMTDWLMVQV